MSEQFTKENWIPIKNPHNPLCGLSYEQVLEELEENSYNLRFVQEQTPELCLVAVQQYLDSLQYVSDEFIHLFQ